MQSAVFGIMNMGGQEISMIGVFFLKTNVRSCVLKNNFLHYKLIGNVVYPMRQWFDSPFKGEKDGLPRYKAHWKCIQSSIRMSMERTFGMLKNRFKILLNRVYIPFCHMPNLVMACICLHNMCITNLDGVDMD
jgi:hypothetical protein